MMASDEISKNPENFRIKTCSGFNRCKNTLADSAADAAAFKGLHKELSSISSNEKPLPGRPHSRLFSVSVSLCPNGCTRPQIADIGVFAVTYPLFVYNRCNACGKCITACREGALIAANEGKPEKTDACIGCGDCFRVCSKGAIESDEGGFKLLLGGKLGRHPHLGEDTGRLYRSSEAITLIIKIYTFWLKNRNPGERLRELMNRRELP